MRRACSRRRVRDDNPVVIFEHKISYRKVKGPVPEEEYVIPLGVADVKRQGRDITIIATSSMVQTALGAATMLEEVGVSVEVVDPRTTWPLDEQTLIESVKKTSRCIVMDEGYGRYGVAAELAAVVRKGRSTASTRRSRGSAPCTCRFRSLQRSRTSRFRPSDRWSIWR